MVPVVHLYQRVKDPYLTSSTHTAVNRSQLSIRMPRPSGSFGLVLIADENSTPRSRDLRRRAGRRDSGLTFANKTPRLTSLATELCTISVAVSRKEMTFDEDGDTSD
jgi:hypothetical protein